MAAVRRCEFDVEDDRECGRVTHQHVKASPVGRKPLPFYVCAEHETLLVMGFIAEGFEVVGWFVTPDREVVRQSVSSGVEPPP